MDWLWAWFAFSLAAGAYYESSKVKKENKSLKERIEKLEEVYRLDHQSGAFKESGLFLNTARLLS